MLTVDQDSLIGQQVGNYLVEELLRQGPVSNLYLATDVKLEHPVFLEVLAAGASAEADLADGFVKRMGTVAKLPRQPGIAPVSEIEADGSGPVFAVIEFVEGGDSMEEWLRRELAESGTVPVSEALNFMRQLAVALGSAHEAGIVHHDLRPDNVLVRQDGSPVFVDLGVPYVGAPTEAVLSKTQLDMIDYASPEQLEGKPIARRSNIYSLGVILYEMLAGHRPHLPASSWDIFERSTMPKEVPLEEVREDLAGETYRLVRNCLWRQEWSRFESTDELIAAIDTAILAEESPPRGTLWTAPGGSWVRYAVGTAVVLAAIVVFFLLLRPRPGTAEGAVAEENGRATTSVPASPTPAPAIIVVSSPTVAATDTAVAETAPATPARITLLPAAGERVFSGSDVIPFDWLWPASPEADQQFAVFLVADGESTLLGTTSEPQNGSLYRLNVSGQEIGDSAEAYSWKVVLEEVGSGILLAESEIVPLNFQFNTPTPTASPEPSATPTVECQLTQPPGWTRYTVSSGDSPSGLAERANVPVESILAANCLEFSAVLSIGQVLFVPGDIVAPSPVPGAGPAATQPPGSGGGSGGGSSGGGSSSPTEAPTQRPPDPPTKTPPPPPSSNDG